MAARRAAELREATSRKHVTGCSRLRLAAWRDCAPAHWAGATVAMNVLDGFGALAIAGGSNFKLRVSVSPRFVIC